MSASTVTNEDYNSLNSQVQTLTSQLAKQELQNNEILNLLRSNQQSSTDRASQPPGDVMNAGDTPSVASDGL